MFGFEPSVSFTICFYISRVHRRGAALIAVHSQEVGAPSLMNQLKYYHSNCQSVKIVWVSLLLPRVSSRRRRPSRRTSCRRRTSRWSRHGRGTSRPALVTANLPSHRHLPPRSSHPSRRPHCQRHRHWTACQVRSPDLDSLVIPCLSHSQGCWMSLINQSKILFF